MSRSTRPSTSNPLSRRPARFARRLAFAALAPLLAFCLSAPASAATGDKADDKPAEKKGPTVITTNTLSIVPAGGKKIAEKTGPTVITTNTLSIVPQRGSKPAVEAAARTDESDKPAGRARKSKKDRTVSVAAQAPDAAQSSDAPDAPRTAKKSKSSRTGKKSRAARTVRSAAPAPTDPTEADEPALSPPPSSGSRSVRSSRSPRPLLSEEETRISIDRLEESISAKEEELEQTEEKEQSILDELERLDMALDEHRGEMRDLAVRQEEKRAHIKSREREVAALSTEHGRQQAHLMNRMRAYYLMGKTGLFNALFSSTGMGELVRGNEAFRSLVTYDRRAFDRFRKSMSEMDEARRSLDKEQEALNQLVAEAGERGQTLQETVSRQKRFLEKVRNERSLHERSIREMNRAQRELAETVTRRAEEESWRNVRGFLSNRGKLPPPMEGPLVRTFGEDWESEEAAPFAHGVTIGVDGEAEARAVYDGVVIFADYMPGYGKTVIVEHAAQYYTVTAKLAEIAVAEKAEVAQGDVLGTADDFSTLISEGLYFEVRRGETPEDPMAWLRRGALVRGERKKAPSGLGDADDALPPPHFPVQAQATAAEAGEGGRRIVEVPRSGPEDASAPPE